MEYYALFLDDNGYIEKRLALIRFIGNPRSKSMPHITLRLFNKQRDGLQYIDKMRITYLNIIEPGTFNINSNKPPFVVFLKCESEELEEIEYKPDYPFSRLHITLYEGSDLTYARELNELLYKTQWNLKLAFKKSKYLTKKTVGEKALDNDYADRMKNIFKEVLGEDINDFLKEGQSREHKIALVERVISQLGSYREDEEAKIKEVESYYLKKDALEELNSSLDNNAQQRDPQESSAVDDNGRNIFYITPPEYAREMVLSAMQALDDGVTEIRFGDPAIGTGALFLALRRALEERNGAENRHYQMISAIGVDVDKEMVWDASMRYGKRGLKVIYGDALSLDIDLEEKRNLMLVNPPYDRHEQIPVDYRREIQRLAEEQTGISVIGDAGLYVYYLLIMDKWLEKGGVAAWLIPGNFMQTKYGKAVRIYLTSQVQLTRIHVYDETMVQFDNANVSTSLIVFRKQIPDDSAKILVSYGRSALDESNITCVDNTILRRRMKNWRSCIQDFSEDDVKYEKSSIKFEDLFNIKRGLATGANSFFVMTREEAGRRGIPEAAVKPLLPKERYLKSLIIDSDHDGYPKVEPQLVVIDCDWNEKIIREQYPLFFKYLQTAEQETENGRKIIERTLVKYRKPWYKQEKREPAPFLLTYMGRNKENLPPLYFIWNRSQAVALNTYILLYPKEWLQEILDKNEALYERLLNALNTSADKIIARQARIYSGALHKLEPGELKGLPVIDLPIEVLDGLKKIDH